jgi:tRNA (guanine37-N1)-methyltransferase
VDTLSRIRFDVLTLFPGMFEGYLNHGLLSAAMKNELVQVRLWNFRDWSRDKHHKVDDRPFGGGPGMVIRPEPVMDCLDHVQADAQPGQVVMMTPAGRRLNQEMVSKLARIPRLILICGRYEGFDDRIRQLTNPLEISIGDYVCNGGEVPAMTVIDTVIRLIPGVLGDEESSQDESHSVPGRLEYPQFTRPRDFRGLRVPDILLSGNHEAVRKWREDQSRIRSQQNQQSREILDPRTTTSDHDSSAT